MYTVGAVIAAILGIGAWIWKLVTDRKELQRQVQMIKTAEEIKEWADEITKLEGRAKEEERDYEEAKKKLLDPK